MSVNQEKDLVLITCASGKQASQIIPLLYGKWRRLRLAVNSESSLERLEKQYPDAEVTQVNMAEPSDCRRIMKDVTAVIQIGPSFHSHETEIDYNMIDAAVEESKNGVFKHFIFSSVLNTQLRKMMNHDCKRYVEEYLMESGLNYTILQPTHFMDTLMFQIPSLMQQETPVYKANFDPNIPFSFIALRDLGEAFAKVLEEREKHYFAQYPLCSTMPISYTKIIETLSQGIQKPIKIEKREYKEAVNAMLTMLFGGTEGVNPRTRDAAQRMLLFYDNRGLIGNPNVLEWLIGRKGTGFEELVKVHVEKAKSAGEK